MTVDYENRIYLSPPHIGSDELLLVGDAIATNWIAPLGPHVEAFEAEAAACVGASGAVALSSGTAAIHLALRVLGVGNGDVVFCSSLTFVASANPILYQGASPVFIDSEPESWNMSPPALERALRDYAARGIVPKAIVVVNLYGQSADYDRLLAIAGRYGVPVVEDAAESLGATYRGKMSGTLGAVGIYSFNGNKIITTSGGGMLVSDDPKLLREARYLAAQARDPAVHYQHSTVGYNYRLSNVLAAIGRGQLRQLEDRIERRRAIHRRYEAALSRYPGVAFMPEAAYGRSNRWLTTMTIDPAVAGVSRDAILSELAARNIEARPVWKPLHLQPLFAGSPSYDHGPEGSTAKKLFDCGLCLPSGSGLSPEEQQRVVDGVAGCLSGAVAGRLARQG